MQRNGFGCHSAGSGMDLRFHSAGFRKLFDKSLTDIEVESINELTYIYTYYPNYTFKENSFAIIKDFQFGQGTADYTINNTDITLTNITVEGFDNTNIFNPKNNNTNNEIVKISVIDISVIILIL